MSPPPEPRPPAAPARPARNAGATRRRILDAAETLAHRDGPSHLSLDAVAAEAGVSKGGLLYHFPSKARLMEALVDDYLARFGAPLRDAETCERPNAVVSAYVTQYRKLCDKRETPPAGLIAALTEDPAILAPVRKHERDFLDRIRANASDPRFATLVFLAISGLRLSELLGTRVLQRDEVEALMAWVEETLDTAA